MNACDIVLMRRMSDPNRLAEDVATFSKDLRQRTDAEAVEDWESEGGARRHAAKSIVIEDLSLVPEYQIGKESKCT